MLPKNYPLENCTFELLFQQYLMLYLKNIGWETDFFHTDKCSFLQLDEASVLISKNELFLFVSKVDFQYHTISDQIQFYSLCVFNNASIIKNESNVLDINITFINFYFHLNNGFRSIQELPYVLKYLENYLIENNERFMIRIQEILSLLDKIKLLDEI